MRPQHRKFAAEYIKNGGNGVQAVFAAGYVQGYNAACVTSSRLLRSAKVRSMVDHITDKAIAAAELTEERVKKEIASIAFSHVDNIDSTAKMKGLDLATKVLGMVTQKVESTSTITTISPSSLSRSIDRISAKTGQNKQVIAQQFLEEFSQKDDPDYNPELETAMRGIVESLQSQQTEQVTEIGDQ